MKTFYTVSIYYGGDGPFTGVFEAQEEALEFYATHDRCDRPEEYTPQTDQEVVWAYSKAADPKA